ncbi:hypothetical protein VTN31DRAFT_7200 [Thermomyces dupontii]|uniref:uncharacterized protein n=1 Tax=Talaromyces thermophilus TaxID=28565 RepID=UPI003742618A
MLLCLLRTLLCASIPYFSPISVARPLQICIFWTFADLSAQETEPSTYLSGLLLFARPARLPPYLCLCSLQTLPGYCDPFVPTNWKRPDCHCDPIQRHQRLSSCGFRRLSAEVNSINQYEALSQTSSPYPLTNLPIVLLTPIVYCALDLVVVVLIFVCTSARTPFHGPDLPAPHSHMTSVIDTSGM